MKIWSWKSAILLWLFSWAWVSVFDACLPGAVSLSDSVKQQQVAQEESEAEDRRVATLEETGSVEISEEERVLYYTALGLPL